MSQTPTCGLFLAARELWIRMQAEACSRSSLPAGKSQCRCRRSRVVNRSQCSPALSAAVTAIPGVVFSGGVSGYLRAYATADARLLWEVDTARDYPIVNGTSARGGAMDGPGPTIADGMLYVNSGYAQWGGLPGNVCWHSKSEISGHSHARRHQSGVALQITPRVLTDAIAAGGDEAKRAFDAMMTMTKIDVAAIEAARRG